MSSISINNISYFHKSPYREIFTDLTVNIDYSWKTGLIGENGIGKTTLLKIISGKLQTDKGSIVSSRNLELFSGSDKIPDNNCLDTVKALTGFTEMEQRMTVLLSENTEESIRKYSLLHEEYAGQGGYQFKASFYKELSNMGFGDEFAYRPFNTLSGGEQTKILVLALFIRKDSYALIDEPANHLDMFARKKLADYLNQKDGFLLVSHDRYLLDACTDHTVMLSSSSAQIVKGNYSAWKNAYEADLAFKERTNENLMREIKNLKKAAKERREWSEEVEKTINAAKDRGYVSARSREQMQRVLSIERRIGRMIEEKEHLKFSIKKKRELQISNTMTKSTLLSVENADYELNGREIFSDIHFTIEKGEIYAMVGPNGCGKTSLFSIITGRAEQSAGIVYVKPGIKVSAVKQFPDNIRGNVEKYLENISADIRKFTYILNYLGYKGNILDKALSRLSDGERKKIDIAGSLSEEADLYLWDEPLNFLDIETREKIEDMLMTNKPAMLISEHDRRFIENIADDIIEM